MEYRNNRRYYSINYDTLDLLINHLNYLRSARAAHLTNPPGRTDFHTWHDLHEPKDRNPPALRSNFRYLPPLIESTFYFNPARHVEIVPVMG